MKTYDPISAMFDVVAHIQSYLGNVARGLDTLVFDASNARFLNLELSFGNTGLSSTYSPWDNIDHFGRGAIRDRIHS